MLCNCEYRNHFRDDKPPYGCQNQAEYDMSTSYGHFKVCAQCLESEWKGSIYFRSAVKLTEEV